MEVEVLDDQIQFVNLQVSSLLCNEQVVMTAVYASCSVSERRQLWDGLQIMSTTSKPWIIMGDFNVIKGPSEQIGCKALNTCAMEDFNDCLLNCKLEDAGFQGSSLSWTNGRASKRLDRVLFNQAYGDLYSTIKRNLQISTFVVPTSDFNKLVEDNWNIPLAGDPLYTLGMKLKRLKGVLKSWNRHTFGNVFSRVEQSEEEVQHCEAAFESSGLVEDREALQHAKAFHLRSLAMKEDFLKQQSGIKWLQEGDRNTAFYHNFVRKKRKKRAVLGIMEEGNWLDMPDDIAQSGVAFYKDLFTHYLADADEEIIDCIPSMVTAEDNKMLMFPPDMEEVRKVVFSLSKDSVAGPDGYNGYFFHNFWPLIAKDVLDAVTHFMEGHNLHQAFTSTVVALLPKGSSPKSWKDYRPISLCNFVNKIMTKLMSTRLATILPKLISDSQAGFVQGRLIQDNILLAQELMHHIDKGKQVGNIILNLDMSKAFDKLSWGFLQRVLRKFGFAAIWIERVMAALDNNWFSKLMAFLEHYQKVSGQLVNAEKSSVILSSKASSARCSIVLKVTGFKRGTTHFLIWEFLFTKGRKDLFFLTP
ncbi:hypothetical protein LIER_17311 [Lithospermum erythrorhizon]|uniref:Reverse transcriptase domain-containing protein n=1 Tax=Lithospermum erythrorhizon TaxID=34254 RepID=A0AAV3QAM2_LITER